MKSQCAIISLLLSYYLYRTLNKKSKSPKVIFVSGGPGDIELITIRGKRAIQSADMIIQDDLVNPEICKQFAHRNCKIIKMGKRGGEASYTQESINQEIVKAYRNHLTIVRLKGGDSMIFGRLASEIKTLKDLHIPFEIVPGVSSMLAACSHLNISLTQHPIGKNICIISAHNISALNVSMLSKVDTLVVFMGTKTILELILKLIQNDKPIDTPIAMVHAASTGSEEYSIVSTIGDFQNVYPLQNQSPSIFIIGQVVGTQSLQ